MIRYNSVNLSLNYLSRLVGDVLLATGFLSYSGPFNQAFRTLLLDNWKKEMRKVKIPFTEVVLHETTGSGFCFDVFSYKYTNTPSRCVLPIQGEDGRQTLKLQHVIPSGCFESVTVMF